MTIAYIRKTRTAFAVALMLASLVFSACSKPHENEAAEEGVAEAVPVFDVVIRGGTLYDGSGEPGLVGDLAINGDRIAAMGDLGEASGKTEIDAAGMAVTPGFINMMSWAPITLIQDGRGMSDIKQGITLEIMGEGHSMGPVNPEMSDFLLETAEAKIGEIPWTTLGEYLQYMEDRGVSPNVASFIGAATVRINELGSDNVKATPEQLERMQELVREAMREGALGVASSLIYTPGTFADTDELIALSKAAAEFGGIYASHMRNEADAIFPALEELITIAREADIHAEIYHLKLASKNVWDRFDELVETVETAQASGLRITADIYTYPAGSTGLDALMPPWANEGGTEAWMKRMSDPETRARIRQEMETPTLEWENMYVSAGPERVLLVGFENKDLHKYVGKTLAEIAQERGTHPADTAMDLVFEDNGRSSAVYFSQSEDVVRQASALPWVSFCTDSEALASEGEFLETSTHPRAYGSFPRLFAKYVREEKMMSIAEAVRKAAALPAENLSLENRGRLAEGYFADVLVFDPATIQDHATFEDPHQYSTGMMHVFVNGEQVIKDGEHTGATPGRFVRGPGWQAGGSDG